MTRFPLLALLAILSACAAPVAQTASPPAPAAATMAFDVPMDPGSISCSQVANPAALTAATDWIMGQARAAVLSGRITALPEQAGLAQDIASFCRENPGRSIRAAITALGL